MADKRDCSSGLPRPASFLLSSTSRARLWALGNTQAVYAYLFSLSSVRYMVDSFGMYRVKTVLEELGKGADTGKAISSGIMISYEEFERGWKRSLE